MIRAAVLAILFAALAHAQVRAPRIDVTGTSFTLEKGFKQVVQFRLDEPIICPQANRECAVVVTITNSHPNRVTMDTCIIKWLWNEWHQTRFLTVSAIENFVNDQALTVTLKTEPAISRSEYYAGFDARDIVLTARPRPSADCSGTGDPHYWTFDRHYWHVYYAGRYVAYRSLVREFEVQVQTYAYPARHCGFAAKEGNDIVVVDACGGTARHRRSCGTQECLNGGFPRVGITGGGGSATYIISFKSGAQVRGDFWGMYMNFYCTAPGIDYGQTVGICGNFNGNPRDDAPIYVANSPNELWANQKPTRDLFAWFPTGPVTPLDPTPPHAVKCEYIEPEFIRPILNNPDVEDITNLIKNGNPNTNTNPGNFVVEDPKGNFAPIDEKQARSQCDAAIRNSVIAKTCQRVLPDFPIDQYILDCADDLFFTGDVSFIEDAIEAMQAVCASLGNKDQTTWEQDNNGQPVEPSKVLQQTLCPNSCSGNGICEKSQCRCDAGFSGVDCSINKSLPPNVTGIVDPFCDSRGLKPCPREINVLGTNFWNSDNLACYFDDVQTKALYLGSQEVLCALPSVTQSGGTTVSRRVTVGTDFRSRTSATFTWYDSVCSVCTNLAGCAPNPQSCTIDSVCYLATQARPDNVCLQCQPRTSNSTWTYTYVSHEDCGPQFELTSYSARIVSEVPAGYQVITMNAANPLVAADTRNTITYSIRGESAFAINPRTGVITTTRALKVSEIGFSFNNLISVTATDSAGNFDQTSVVINFVQTNQSPVFKLDGYTLTIAENSPIGTKLGQITAEDKDPNAAWSKLTYEWFSLEQGHENDFNVNPNDGTITVGAPIDFEKKKSYELHLKAKDGGNQFHVTTITVNVINVDEAPTKITLSNTAVNENSAAGTVVGQLTSEDPEGGPFTYTVDNSNFRIAGNSLVTAASFNFEAVSRYTVNVRSTDPTAKFLVQQFTITVTDVNEKPYGIALGTTTFDEDAKVDSILTAITVKDDDAGQKVGCSLADSFSQTFEISGSNLVLLKPLDFEGKLAYKIVVVCADDGTPVLQSDAATFSFTINDKNDAPESVMITVNGGRIAEDAQPGAVIGTISAVDNDKDAGDIKFAIGADNTKFGLGTPKCTKSASGSVSCTVDVVLRQALDFENDPSETITLTATDNKNLASVTKLEIPVSNVNEAPTGVEWIDGKNKVMEGASVGTVIGQIKAVDADVDAPGATYQFELIGGDGIVSLRQARRAISGPVVTVVVADSSMLDFEKNPVVTFKIKVTDAGGLSVVADAQVLVENEPVVMWANTAKNSNFEVEENTPVGTTVATVVLTGFDRADELSFTLSLADDSKGQFSVSGRSIVVAGPIDYEAATTGFIEVKATYARINPASNVAVPPADVSRINFAVKNKQEPPVFGANKYFVTVSDDANVGTSLRVEPPISALDPESKAVRFSISEASNPSGIFSISDDGTIRMAKMPSAAGVKPRTYSLEIIADDGSMPARALVAVAIEDGCVGSPCKNGARCVDAFNGYTCTCASGFGGSTCESSVTLESKGDSNSSGSIAGIVVGCIVGVLLVLVILFVVFRNKSKERRDTESGGSLLAKSNHFAHNPTFIDPSVVDNRSPEYAPVVRFVPGVANPMYDWYQPDMNRNECNDYLMSQGEGAFVVRDSKATPGWHMLGVKSSNQVVHDKIRMNEDGTYSLIPTASSRPQPSFPDIPSLVQYYAENKTDVQYALAFSNPIYDNHLMKSSTAAGYAAPSAPILPNDPAAPVVPLKERELNAVHALANQESEDIYTNTEEAKLAVSSA